MRSFVKGRLREFCASTGGNVALITAIAAPVLGLVVAGVLTVVEVSTQKRELQDRLDGAVLAGAAYSLVAKTQIDAAERHFAATSPDGGSAKFSSRGDLVSGVASLSVEAYLAKLAGVARIPVTVNAAARRPKVSICILGLNNLDNGAFDINGGPTLNAPECGVQANSGSSRAMTQEGASAKAQAKLFAVHGDHQTNTFKPVPQAKSDRIEDPFANTPFPHHGTCASGGSKKGLVIQASTVLQPGTYCGGINITGNGTTVTMAPGRYVMVDGSLLVNGNARLEGSEVVVAFTGADATLRLWGGSTVKLTSPTTGLYANLQFFQDRHDSQGRGAWVSIGGNGGPNDAADTSKLDIQGTMYFPTQNIWVYGRADVNISTPGLAMVGDKIWIQGASTVDVVLENPRGLKNFKSAEASSRNAWLVR